MKNIKNKNTLTELNLNELANIEGGAPTPETGFWYDLTWGMAMDIRLRFYYGLVY